MTQTPLIIGNWKMHKTIAEAVAFVKVLEERLDPKRPPPYLAVPFTAIRACSGYAVHSWIGAQNMCDAAEGAYTGEISAHMLVDAGARFVLLGHSERRYLFGEGDGLIRRKVERAIQANLRPILCVGEHLEERQAGQTEAVIGRQLEAALAGLEGLGGLTIAYEPVWAIGTGQHATPEQAQLVHQFIRRFIPHVSILYGGSVHPDNAAALLKQPDVDGLLVGRAALEVDSFLSICNAGR